MPYVIDSTTASELLVTVDGNPYVADPSSKEAFDRKTEDLDACVGSRFATVDTHDGDAESKAAVNVFLSDACAALLAICGFGATVGVPVPKTIVYNLPSRTVTVPNATCATAELVIQNGKVTMLNAEFWSSSPPARTAGYGLTAPAGPAAQNFFYHRDLLSFFTAASAGVTGLSEFRVKLDHQLDPIYGVRSDGLTLPIGFKAGNPKVTGSFRMRMLGFDDYDRYLAACQVAADLGITAKPFCASGAPTLTVTPKNTIYTMPQRDGAMKQSFVEVFNFRSRNVAGANPLVATLL